ncbi:AraC family transcriptional regulator [Pseudotenacibaculum sp. MALMAid0570]|uniref:helix-turn-helix domain-containing protein n=1 Tax=Pseudotenacibaculum sp. MALMAid0570 TaxID=3143938 RepID=UPI0032DE5C5E
MKSKNIILFLGVLMCSKVFALAWVNPDSTRFNLNADKDRFYKLNLVKTETLFVQNIIQELENIEGKQEDLTNEDLKNLAIGYAYLKKPEKSILYAKKFIKRVLDVSILTDKAFLEIKESNEYKEAVNKYLPKMNFFVLALFSCGLMGFFLSVVLNLRRKGDQISNLIIGVFLFSCSLFSISGAVLMSRNHYNSPTIFYVTAPFLFLFGPLLYFYFKRISERYRFKWVDLLHLAPFLLVLILTLPIYFLTEEQKLQMIFNKGGSSPVKMLTMNLARLTSLFVYAFLTYKIYKNNKKEKGRTYIIKWQRNIVYLNFTFGFSYFSFVFFRKMKLLSTDTVMYPQVLLMALLILYIGYVAYVNPRVFSKKYLFNEKSLLKYKKSGLTISFSEELKDRLLMLLNEDKIFKKNNINLEDLAQELGTTRHNISQVINEHFEMNFFHLINKYRIAEAKEILKSDYNRNLNIIDIAYDVGFNNKVTFNKAFKAETNMTPSDYVQYIQLGFSG